MDRRQMLDGIHGDGLPLTLVTYDTPEELLKTFWQFGDETADFEGCTFGGEDAEGNEVEFDLDDMVDGVKKQGMWGYAESKTGKVHIWVDPASASKDVMFFLGHELGHLSGTPIEQTTEPGDIREEKRADEYATVAKTAFEWMGEILK